MEELRKLAMMNKDGKGLVLATFEKNNEQAMEKKREEAKVLSTVSISQFTFNMWSQILKELESKLKIILNKADAMDL
jgi:hypothetical protein